VAKVNLADLVRNRKTQIAAGAAGVAAMQPEDSEAIILRAATPTVKAAPSYAYKATPENLERALDMFDEGVSPRDIYDETGFFKGADGVLRFEVSDKGTIYIVESDRQHAMSERGQGRLLSEAVDHPSMDLRDDGTPSNAIFAGEPGSDFDPIVRELDLSGTNTAGYATGDEIVLDRNYTLPELREKQLSSFTPESILLHEQQHILQGKMGMAPGGNQGTKRRSLDQMAGPTEAQEAAEARRMDLVRNSRGLGPLETVIQYRGYAKEGMSPNSNLTGKRRLLVGNSYWYEFGDEIRRELGPEPKRHRPKQEREDWLREAWNLMANKIETRAGPDAKLNALRLVKPELFEDPQMTFGKLADKYDELVANGEIQRKDLVNASKRVQTQLRKVESDAQEYRDLVYRQAELRDLPPSEFYRRLGGEVEARNVQTRMDMSQEELYGSYPRDTEDVPREKQILRNAPLQQATLGAVAGGIGLTSADNVYAEEIPNMQAVAQRAQTFASNRDNKNKAWTGLKDAVGKMTQPFQPLAEFVAHSAAGMGSGLVGAVGYSETDIPAQTIEQGRQFVRDIPQQMGFGPIDENAYQVALNQAMEGIADTVINDNAMRAFVDPVLQDVGPELLEQYQQLDPRTQGMLSGLGEYIGNAIR
jgi:hypothetical protein